MIHGLYIHTPFCKSKCPYCDFASIPMDTLLIEPYIDALGREFERIDGHLAPKTIYIGGGTPTIFDDKAFSDFLDVLQAWVDTSDVKEWTIEANPGTLTSGKIQRALDAGINRFSVGMQSLDNRTLKFLGRAHTTEDTLEAFALLRGQGVDNISLDIMFGTPGTTTTELIAGLGAVAEMKPEHVSTYGLTYEDDTPFAEAVACGDITPKYEDEELEMYVAVVDTLQEAGYQRYEVSNYALPGRECLHNMAYWEGREVLGVGPSAVSYIVGERKKNASDLTEYIDRLQSGKSAVESTEKLLGRPKGSEALYLALRMTKGITGEEFLERTGMVLFDTFGPEIERLVEIGAVTYEQGRLALTDQGFPVADSVMVEFM